MLDTLPARVKAGIGKRACDGRQRSKLQSGRPHVVDSQGKDTITDFAAGIGGDVLDIADVLTGYTDGVSDPDQFIQLADVGGNTVIRADADGPSVALALQTYSF